MSRVLYLAGLVGAWCTLWGDVSVANLLSGAAIAALLLFGFGALEVGAVRVNAIPLARFVFLVTKDAVLSTVAVASEVLTPTDYTQELVTTVVLPEGSSRHLLLLTIVVTLTPGTAVVDTDPDAPSVTIHLLHADREEATRAHIVELAELAMAAWPQTGVSTTEAAT